MDERHPKVLIVGTIPYNPNTSSRAFDAYFHRFEKENLRQIFSNTKTPVKGHCEQLYQITDKRLLTKRLKKSQAVGRLFYDKELPIDWKNNDLEVGHSLFSRLYKCGSKESSLKHLGRKWLWNEKYWNTKELRDWLDEFQPECVFLAFSDDFFILEIALFVARRFSIPIVSCIGDDYYFNDKRTFSPLYYIYRKQYKALVRTVFAHGGSAIYIGDKIRDKYNKEFGLNGETVYLTSEIQRQEFRPIRKKGLNVSYCGNVRLGRNTSLVDIATALQKIDPTYKVDVYSPEQNKEFLYPLTSCTAIRFHGRVPYDTVMKVTGESDLLLVVEGFEEQQVNATRYSLSTKAADVMASGRQILAYGSMDCGVIEYMDSVGCAVVCTNRDELGEKLQTLLSNESLQKQYYDRAVVMTAAHHDKEKNLTRSETIFQKAIAQYKKG